MLLLTLYVISLISLVAGDDDGKQFLCPRKCTHVGEATFRKSLKPY